MTILEAFGLGIVGGAIPEVFALYNLRYSWHKEQPTWVKSGFYWIVTVTMVLLGGGTAALYVYMNVSITALMAIHLGISTPVLIQTALKENPKIN